MAKSIPVVIAPFGDDTNPRLAGGTRFLDPR
jgi:hypothetical protein